MRAITFTIPGRPVPQGRPRFTTKSGGRPLRHPLAFDPPKSRKWKAAAALVVRLHARETGWERLAADVPVRVRLVAIYARPLSMAGDERAFHVVKPDGDNLLKPAKDAITASGVVWHDDCQVAIGETVKVWGRPGEAPRVEILIERLEGAC